MLTTSELREMSGLPRSTLNELVESGLLVPAVRGSKQSGTSHEFGLMQAVAVVYAAALREIGIGSRWVAETVSLVPDLTPEVMERNFKEGLTSFIPAPGGGFFARPSAGTAKQFSLETAYRRVRERMKSRELVTA